MSNTVEQKQERLHHPFSPSKLQFLEACPCYVERGGPVHEKALIGTRQHAVTETREDDHALSDDEATHAAECMDFYERHKGLYEEARNRAMAETCERLAMQYQDHPDVYGDEVEANTPLIEEIVEEYLPVDGSAVLVGDTLFKGTSGGYCDRALIDHTRTRAKMFDWKFGQWPVEAAENNLQGIAYALGLFRKVPTLAEITFYFKQPVLNLISMATWRRDQVPALYLRVLTVVENAKTARQQGDFASARPLVPACLFCGNVGKCPKVTAAVCTIGRKFYPLEVPETITPTSVLDPANASAGLRLAAVVEVWAGAFRRQTTDRTLRGGCPIPTGYRLASRSDREVADKAKFKILTLQHLTEAEYEAMVDPPAFGKVEKKISEKAPRGAKKDTVELFKKALEDSGAVVKGQPYSFLRAVASQEGKIESDE